MHPEQRLVGVRLVIRMQRDAGLLVTSPVTLCTLGATVDSTMTARTALERLLAFATCTLRRRTLREGANCSAQALRGASDLRPLQYTLERVPLQGQLLADVELHTDSAIGKLAQDRAFLLIPLRPVNQTFHPNAGPSRCHQLILVL